MDAGAGYVIAATHVEDMTERKDVYMSSLTRASSSRPEQAREEDSHFSRYSTRPGENC